MKYVSGHRVPGGYLGLNSQRSVHHYSPPHRLPLYTWGTTEACSCWLLCSRINHVYLFLWKCVCVFITQFVFVCVGGSHRCSPHTGALCSLALAPIGWPRHGGGVGASVRLYGQLHHRSVCLCCACLYVLCVCAGTVPGPCLPIASVCSKQSDWVTHI